MAPPTTSPSGINPSTWDPRLIGLFGLICGLFILFTCYKLLDRNCGTFNVLTLAQHSTHTRRRINEHLEEQLSLQFPSAGLDSCIMHSLPITQMKKSKDARNTECAVCLAEFEEDEWVKHLPLCSHVFHVSCIDTWFQAHSSCPLCRSFVHNFNSPHEYLMSRLNREDFRRERLEHFLAIRSRVLQNIEHRVDVHDQDHNLLSHN